MVGREKCSENSVDKTVERTYERLGKRIRDRFSDKAVARDIVTLGGMRRPPRPLRASPLRKRGDESRGVSYAQNPVSMPQLRGASALRRNPPRVMQTRTSPLVQDVRQPLLRVRRGGMAAHGRALFRGHAIEAVRHLIQTRLR